MIFSIIIPAYNVADYIKKAVESCINQVNIAVDDYEIIVIDDGSNDQTGKIIDEYVNLFLEQNIASYLYKTSKEYKTDIGNFGRYVIGNYTTWNDWIESDWLFNYQNAFFDVNVETNIENGQLYTRI